MKTRLQKQYEWVESEGRKYFDAYFVYMLKGCPRSDLNIAPTSELKEYKLFEAIEYVGIFALPYFIPIPDFQDDQPEPKDKALQEYIGKLYICNDATELKAWQEINLRLKALEAANERA